LDEVRKLKSTRKKKGANFWSGKKLCIEPTYTAAKIFPSHLFVTMYGQILLLSEALIDLQVDNLDF